MACDDERRDRARAEAAAGRWRTVHDLLDGLDHAGLTADDLMLLADAAFWRVATNDEIVLRQRAFSAYVADGEDRRATYAAWLLSVRFGLRGDPVAASGWLQRAQRQISGQGDCVERGYVACGECEQALSQSRGDLAEHHAAGAVAAGHRFDDRDLVALGLSWQGLCRLSSGDLEGGARCLDEAMASVTAGEVDPFFTGWVYCFVIGMCMNTADLRRAGTWTEQAWTWAASLPEPTPYRGLCRVKQVEVLSLRGELELAALEARTACAEMIDFEPNLAGEAFYVAGDVLRRLGDLDGAEQAFVRARELGEDPQPGLALVRLAAGRVDDAAAALRTADPERPPYRRASLHAAQVEVALAVGDLDEARTASEALAEVAAQVTSDALVAMARTARGRVHLAEADATAALAELRPAVRSWRALELACEVAEARALVALAMRELGDRESAEDELRTALAALERCGAAGGIERITALAAQGARSPVSAGTRVGEPAQVLSPRELEVLGQLASGRTNRQIAVELVVSEHTVARHVSNIFTKLGVSSRTAAAAYGFEHGLVGPSDPA